jgi:hypothetical protein
MPLHMTASSQEGMSSHVWLAVTLSTDVYIYMYASSHLHASHCIVLSLLDPVLCQPRGLSGLWWFRAVCGGFVTALLRWLARRVVDLKIVTTHSCDERSVLFGSLALSPHTPALTWVCLWTLSVA